MRNIWKLILKGSLAGTVALAAVTACGGDDDDDGMGAGGEGGGSDTAGTSNGASSNVAGEPGSQAGSASEGGATGEAGAPQGGTTPGSGGASADGGATEGGSGSIFGGASSGGAGAGDPASAKFCNTLGGDPTTLRLEVAQGVNKVTFTAASGECAPADGEACSEIQSGQAVIVSLFDESDDTLPLYVNPQKISDGESYVFAVEEKGNDTIWNVRALKAGVVCSDVTYADL